MPTNIKQTMTLIILSGFLFAGSTGKIGGLILDVKTGKPLAGVNVIISGTEMGAATRLDGSFMIINIPPGTYSVSATMIGYKKYNISDVNVSVDRTSRLSIKLSETVIEGEDTMLLYS